MSVSKAEDDNFQHLYLSLAEEFKGSSAGALVLSLLLEQLPALVSLSTKDGRLLFASRAHAALAQADQTPQGVSQETLTESLFSKEAWEQIVALPVQDPLDRSYKAITLKHRDGSNNTYDFKKTALHLKGKTRVLLIATKAASTSSKPGLHEQQIRSHPLEYRDAKTGIANRNLFYDRLDKTLSQAKRNKTHFALLLVDFDHFQAFNDAHGRDVGDRYLQHVAKRFYAAVRDTDTVARMSGDEFIIILDNVDKAKDIELVAHKLLEPEALVFSLGGKELACSASMGISLFPKDGTTADDLMRAADNAMSGAKRSGKNKAQFYIKEMTDAAAHYLLLENDLRKAIESHDIELYFQPQVDITNSKICGVEVLSRWRHSSRGLLAPAHFIPLAEETGMIEVLGRWVLQQSCQYFQKWLEQGIDLGKLSVNVSARQFRNPNFKAMVEEVLASSGLSHQRLELELTETSTMENATWAIDVLTELRSAGVSVALDDFGTGYSSLSYLRRFPIQKLKIDKSFIDKVDRDSGDAATAKSIIDLAHNMSLEVIAEGVERKEQIQWLKEKGCHLVQGYYYAKALSHQDLMRLVNDSNRSHKQGDTVFLTRGESLAPL